MRLAWAVALTFLAATPAVAGPCENLASFALPHAAIASAEIVAPGAFPPPQGRGPARTTLYQALPAFCRVSATLHPVADSHINVEVWMPVSGWNRKLQSVGNGAWAGSISYPAMATALAAGYAAASTDTGHTGNSGSFILGHPAQSADFAYRAVHE